MRGGQSGERIARAEAEIDLDAPLLVPGGIGVTGMKDRGRVLGAGYFLPRPADTEAVVELLQPRLGVIIHAAGPQSRTMVILSPPAASWVRAISSEPIPRR